MAAVPFLLCLAATVLANIEAPVDSKHSFKGPFLQGGTSELAENWAMGGSAVLTDSFVRLTPAIKDRRGWLWSKHPVIEKNWEAELEFKVGGGRPPGADGFAFWYAQTPEMTGPIYGNVDRWLGLGVIFDTYDNDKKSNNPYILAMLNDGTISYDHVNDGLTNQLGGCVARYRSLSNTAKAKVTYKDHSLDVYISLSGQHYEPCLHADNIHLPTGFYFGMSAATGALSDNHDIYSLTIRNLDPPARGEVFHGRNVERDSSPPSSTSTPTANTATRVPASDSAPAPPPSPRTASPSNAEKESLFEQQLHQMKSNPAYSEASTPSASPPATLGTAAAPAPVPDAPTAPLAPSASPDAIQRLDLQLRGLHRDVTGLAEMVKTMYSLLKDPLEKTAQVRDLEPLSQSLGEVQRALASVSSADIRGELARLRDHVSDRLGAVTKDTSSKLENIQHQIITVHDTVESATSQQQMLRDSIAANQQQIEKKVSSSNRWTFIYWVVIFQVFFFGVFIWWKKSRDDSLKLP